METALLPMGEGARRSRADEESRRGGDPLTRPLRGHPLPLGEAEAAPMSEASASDPLAAAYAECEALVREGDRDRWLASLFAPAAARRHLYALYAFSFEIARVREIVSDPLPGEVRYQ